MQAERTVTVYGGNRLDEAREIEPTATARQFIEAVRAGYFAEPTGRGGEWAYRLWLTAKDGLNVSWDCDDDGALMDALAAVIAEDDEIRTMLIRAVWGDA